MVRSMKRSRSTDLPPSTGQQLWIGLAQVEPWVGNDLLGNAAGAFVPVIGDAGDETDFLALVERELGALQFDVLALEDVELLSTRVRKHKMPADLSEAIAALSPENPLALGTFEAYLEADS